jgi:2-(1,2-epoxy-1,2-dihydrophenyl)acetyl-CoA isomerase
MNAPVLVDVRAGVGHITLASPAGGNAIGLATAQGLLHAAQECERQRVRAVLLTAQGGSFCVGGDLREFAGLSGPALSGHLLEVTAALHQAQTLLASLDAPMVAAVQGAVAGAGVGLACAADITVAADDVKFVLAYTGIGLTPDAGATWSLPRLVGTKRALDLLLLNQPLTAHDALAAGLVSRVVPAQGLAQTARELTDRLAAGPTAAFGVTRRLVQEGWSSTWREQLARESVSIASAATSSEGIEGMAAFLGKRKPSYFSVAEEPSAHQDISTTKEHPHA